MPEERMPDWKPTVDIDAPWTPLKLAGDAISDEYALTLVSSTFERFEQWRTQNCDQRWRLNDWLYYGRVPLRVWEGTSIPRSSLPVQIAYDQVEAAHAKLSASLLTSDEVFGVSPDGDTSPEDAAQIKERLIYLLDHNVDDFGWNGRLELKQTLRDLLIYGNCFGMVEYDHVRKQAVIRRVDPRDVYVDGASISPYTESLRSSIVRKLFTVQELEDLRGIPGINVPSEDVLMYLAKNTPAVSADTNKRLQDAARGFRSSDTDNYIPLPSDRFVEVLIYQDKAREIWTLNRKVTMINTQAPYGCTRLVSAPCSPVPNRFYAQSYVDILDPIQRTATSLLNLYMDEMALALNPPRVAKRGVIRTPSSLTWRPGLLNESENPKEDFVVQSPQGVTDSVWQAIGFLEQQAEKRTGQNSLATNGLPRPGNANRTRGGMAMQMQAPAERLSAIASNFEEYFLTPMFYKMLRVEKMHAEGDVYEHRSTSSNGSFAAARAALDSITTARD